MWCIVILWNIMSLSFYYIMCITIRAENEFPQGSLTHDLGLEMWLFISNALFIAKVEEEMKEGDGSKKLER